MLMIIPLIRWDAALAVTKASQFIMKELHSFVIIHEPIWQQKYSDDFS